MELAIEGIPNKRCADGLYFTPHTLNPNKSSRRSGESFTAHFHSSFPLDEQLQPSAHPSANNTDRTLRTKPLRNHSTALSPICDFDNPKVLIQRLKLASQSGTGRKCNLQFPKVASRCKLFLCTACAEYLSHPRFMEKFGCMIHSENSHPFHFHNYVQLRERKGDPKKRKIDGFQCFEESKLHLSRLKITPNHGLSPIKMH